MLYHWTIDNFDKVLLNNNFSVDEAKYYVDA